MRKRPKVESKIELDSALFVSTCKNRALKVMYQFTQHDILLNDARNMRERERMRKRERLFTRNKHFFVFPSNSIDCVINKNPACLSKSEEFSKQTSNDMVLLLGRSVHNVLFI